MAVKFDKWNVKTNLKRTFAMAADLRPKSNMAAVASFKNLQPQQLTNCSLGTEGVTFDFFLGNRSLAADSEQENEKKNAKSMSPCFMRNHDFASFECHEFASFWRKVARENEKPFAFYSAVFFFTGSFRNFPSTMMITGWHGGKNK